MKLIEMSRSDDEIIEEFNSNKYWGLALSIDLSGCNHDIISSKTLLEQFAKDVAKYIDMKTYGDPIVVFFGSEPKVQGYSLMQLVETSLISGHFAEDTNRAFIDVFSCKAFAPQITAQYVMDYFHAQHMSHSMCFRDIPKYDHSIWTKGHPYGLFNTNED